MMAVVLAAGLGERLGQIKGNLPKPLLKIGNRELISYSLDHLTAKNTKTVVVTGYCREEMENYLRQNYPGVSTVHNARFTKGSILSLLAALPAINEDFLLLNADHVYSSHHWEIFTNPRIEISAMCDFDRKLGDDDMKVKVTNSKLNLISKSLSPYDGGYIGVTFCPLARFATYSEAVRSVADTDVTLPVEAALGWLSTRGAHISIVDASGGKWWEIDDASDYKKASEEIKP